jgi:PqqD family protein of HPr-rel-A system
MKLKTNIATSESGFVFNPSSGDSFSVNPVGAEILMLLKDDNSTKEIMEIILSRFEVDPVQFERDLDDYITQLRDHNLLD